MNRNTPGPWTATITETTHFIKTAENRILADVRISPEQKWQVTEANAWLMSAAPDLLSACLEFLACGPNAGHNHELTAKMRAAIEKAEGRE